MNSSLHNMSDGELINLFKNGCEPAFEQMMARYHQRLLSYVTAMVHNVDAANNILQDVLIQIISALRQDKYVDIGRFGMWALRIAHNAIIDYFRDQMRERERIEGTPIEEIPSTKFPLFDEEIYDLNVEENIVKREQKARLHFLVRRLPPEQRQIVMLRYNKNLPFKDIAEMLHISINTALGRMHYAVGRLRQMMAQ